MVGLDQNADTAGALVQATRSASASSELRQATRGELFFERGPDRFRPLLRATTLLMAGFAPVGADKKITLSKRHAGRFAARAGYFKIIARLIAHATSGTKTKPCASPPFRAAEIPNPKNQIPGKPTKSQEPKLDRRSGRFGFPRFAIYLGFGFWDFGFAGLRLLFPIPLSWAR